MLLIALFLGILEGMTEFLPVSSTGHLILFVDLLKFEGPKGKSFEIIIQLGAILAICCLYHKKLTAVITGIFTKQPSAWIFTRNIFLAFFPAIIAGGLFHKAIKLHLFNPTNVSIALLVGGIIMLLVEKRIKNTPITEIEDISAMSSLKIGLFQCLALIPGTSRSGATIIGALLLGVERKTAAEFSFFLAVPTMVAATAFQVYSDWNQLSSDGIQLIAIGFIAAFFSALLIVRWAINFIAKRGFAPFAWYRILLGSGMLIYLTQS